MRSLRLFRNSNPKHLFLLPTKRCRYFHSLCELQDHLYSSSKLCSSLFASTDPIFIANALSLSDKLKSFALGSQIHACIFKLGFTNDIFLQNNLIKMYTKRGVLRDGLKVFEEMPETNLVSWTLMISAASQAEEFELGLKLYIKMTRNGLIPNEFAIGSAMKLCMKMGATDFGLSIHCCALKIGIEKNPFVGCSVLSLYAKLGDVEAAESVFGCIANVDLGCWNSMIGGYAQCGYGFEALSIVSSMLSKGMKLDKYTFINALHGCSILGDFSVGRQIHGLLIRSQAEFNTSVMNSLVDMYVKNSGLDSALKVFERMTKTDVVSWNVLFGGFSQFENPREIVSLFSNFMCTGIGPNHITFSILFRQCGELPDLNLGLQFYGLALRFGPLDEVNVTGSLINMFSKCRAMEMARLLFESVPVMNIVIWNELISGYNLHCYDIKVLETFRNLRESGIEPNEYTFFCILDACSRSNNQLMCRQIHGAIIKSGFASCEYVCSSLIKTCVKLGQLDNSFTIFNRLQKLDITTWGIMVSSLVHQGYIHEALMVFHSLIESGQQPDEYILGNILSSCADIGAYHHAKSIHPFIIKLGFDRQVFVASSVIDAYAKCGDIIGARLAFDHSIKCYDVIIYNTLIMGYAHHGLVREAMEIFNMMKLVNLTPSKATFVSVLLACSHSGLVDLGCQFFESMYSRYGIEPSPDIFGCLVDMFSRNGRLEDAKTIIEAMPFPPWPAIWRSLLSGCRIHGNHVLGEVAAKRLLELPPEKGAAAYLLLSKVYSEGGSWEEVAKVRREMTEKRVLKDPSYSWIET